jgi:hypothetical protein
LRAWAALPALAAALALPGQAAALDVSGFRWTRELEEPERLEGAPPAELLVFEPDAALVAHTRPRFADLRILDADGEDVPWRHAPPPEATPERAVELLDAGRQGPFAVAVADLGPGQHRVDRIELDVPQEDFVGRVEVASSADRRTWTILASTSIYDIASTEGRDRSTAVTFGPTGLQYLRLRATGIRRIAGATVVGSGEPVLVEWPGRSRTTSRDPTRVVVDLRYRNLPIDAVRIGSPAPRFERPVTVEVSNGGGVWRVVARTRIFKVPGATPDRIEVGARGRLVRVTIENGDDPPLPDVTVDVLRRRMTLLVEGGHEPTLRAYYGDPGVGRPSYEFARLPVPDAARRPLLLRPERRTQPVAQAGESFVDRHPFVVQASLAVAAFALAVVGFLALRRRT